MGQSCVDGVEGVFTRRLLIAQRNELLRRSLHRYFLRHFDKTIAVANPSDAEAALRNVELKITDLICGQEFGSEWPRGSELIAAWRAICPSLRQVVLFTARDDIPADLPGVDAIWHKPLELPVLYARLINT